MIFKIAFKNVWRNKVRSLIVIIAITLGLAGGILTVSIITGMVEQKIRTGINNEVSHIQVHNPDFLKNYESQYSIPHADSITGIISMIPGVKAVCSRTRITGMIASSNSASGIQMLIVDFLRMTYFAYSEGHNEKRNHHPCSSIFLYSCFEGRHSPAS